MKKTKIDWCDSTINCVYGCPNGCKYCYGNVMNKRFHFCRSEERRVGKECRL